VVVGDVIEPRSVREPAHVRVIPRTRTETQFGEAAAEVGPAQETDLGIEIPLDHLAVERQPVAVRVVVKHRAIREIIARQRLRARIAQRNLS
jgi:hypothetical protein